MTADAVCSGIRSLPSPPMYVASLFAFVTAAILGITMAVLHFRGVESGRALGIVHGAFAASGIVLLASGLYRVAAGPWWWLLAAFGVTALGGLYLFSRQARDKPWPGAVIVLHGAAALASIALLAVWIFGRADEIEPVQPTVEQQLQNDVGRGGANPRQATP